MATVGNDEVRYRWHLCPRLLANLCHVFLEKPDDIRRTQRQSLPSYPERKAASIEVAMDSGGEAVVTKAGDVDLAFRDAGRDCGFGHPPRSAVLGAEPTQDC
jgi:hypothetical protein